MEVRSWKRILMHWISQCKFLEINFLCIEQANILQFFSSFCNYHEVAAECENSFMQFLRIHYPDYHPHYNDENELNPDEYVYAYSLLLHFACVKYPEVFFHKICQQLPDASQESIATFLQQIDNFPLSKEYIKYAIAGIASGAQRAQSTEISISNSASIASSSNSSNGASPKYTPKRQQNKNTSPATPKTFLLDDRTRELYNLRAKFETERYEKNMLEVTIEQKDKKILELTNSYKALKQQINELRSELLNKSVECSPPTHENDEAIKRRLCKEINQKEGEIQKLTDILSTIKEEKALAVQKLNVAEKQNSIYLKELERLETKIEESDMTIQKKDSEIKYLTEINKDLEHFINETRGRGKLNDSEEFLDSSFEKASQSSGSINSPENLGCTVVDIQLREKENENTDLRKQLLNMQDNNARLAKHIQQTALKKTQEFNIVMESSNILNDENCKDPLKYFDVYADFVNTMSKMFKDERNTVMKMNEDAQLMQSKNQEMLKEMKRNENELQSLRQKVEATEQQLASVEQERKMLNEKLDKSACNIETLQRENHEFCNKLQNMREERNSFANDIQKLNALVLQLQCQTENTEQLKDKHAKQNVELQIENEALKKQHHDLKERYLSRTTDDETKMKGLSERMLAQTIELQTRQKAEQLIKEKYEKLLVQLEEKRNECRNVGAHMQDMRSKMEKKEQEMSKLGNEIVEMRKKNAELSNRLEELMHEMNNTKHSSDMAINSREQQIQEIEKEREKSSNTVVKLQTEMQETQSELHKCREEIRAICEKIELILQAMKLPKPDDDDEIIMHLDTILKTAGELYNYQQKTASQLECLRFEKLDNAANLKLLEDKLKRFEKEKDALAKTHAKHLTEMQLKLKESDSKVKELEMAVTKKDEENKQQKDYIEGQCAIKMQDLLAHTESVCHEYEKVIKNFAEEMSEERERFDVKTHESKESKKKQHEMQKKLSAHEEKFEALEQEYYALKTSLRESKEELEQQQQELSKAQAEKEELNIQLKCMKGEQADVVRKMEQRIAELQHEHKESNKALQLTSEQLADSEAQLKTAEQNIAQLEQKQCASNSKEQELQKTLKERENSLLEAEKRARDGARKLEELNEMLMDKKNKLQKLKTTHEAQNGKQQQKITQLEHQLNEHAHSMALLKQKLCDKEAENSQILQDAAAFTAKIEAERLENEKWQHSMQHAEIQLQLKFEEKTEYAASLNKRCDGLQAKLLNMSEQRKLLQDEMDAKNILIDQQQQKLSQLFQQLSEETLKAESYEEQLQTITACLQENCSLTQVCDAKVKNIFHVVEDANDGNELQMKLNKLKHVLNCTVAAFDCLEAKFMAADKKLIECDYIAEALRAEVEAGKTEIAKLQNMINVHSKTLEEQLNTQLKNQSERIETLEHDNAALQLKAVGQREELATAKMSIALLDKEKQRLCNDLKFKQEIIAKNQQDEQKHMQTLKEQQAAMQKQQEKLKELNSQLADMSELLCRAEQTQEKSKQEVEQLRKELCGMAQQRNAAVKGLQEYEQDVKLRCKEIEKLENELRIKNKEFNTQMNNLSHLSLVRKDLQDKQNTLAARLEETLNDKLQVESKMEQLNADNQQLQRDLQLANMQNKALLTDVERFSAELSQLKEEKAQLAEELRDGKREATRSADNISELIQQVSTLRQEKEHIMAESALLRKQQAEREQSQNTCDVKVKAIIEESQSMQRQLLKTENELKSLQAQYAKSQEFTQKWSLENKKLIESQEAGRKRVEKLAVKLGESQSSCTKLQSDCDKLSKTLEAKSSTIMELQRERDALQIESKALKQSLIKIERAQELLTQKVELLQRANAMLENEKKKLEKQDANINEKLGKMEKTHAANEEKIKRLDAALNDSENAKVRLNLEIGALNSELQELKRVSEQEKCDKEAQLKHALLKTEAFEQLCAQLEQERNELLEQKSNINDKHSKAMLAQKIAKDECETLADELKVLQEAYYNLQADKLQLEAANANSQSELKQSEALRADLLNEKEALHNEMQQQKQDFNADVKLLQEKLCQLNEEKLQLEAQHCDVVQRLVKAEASVAEKQQLEKQLNAEMLKLAAKDQVITELNNEISQLKDEKSLINAEMTSLQQLKEQNNAELRTLNNKVEDLLAAKQQQSETIAALEALRARLTASEELLEKEQKFAAQMRLDNQILQAKYREAKERAIEQAQASEERIKENRLELEGKLEKMKSKMKSLYNDETSKLKTKHEREVANMKSEMDVLRLQNKKYEDHTSKLSKQIVRLNEQNLQYQKENAIFLTNIKHYEDTRAATLPFKRPTSNVPTNSATTAALPSTSTRSLGTNLAMEDEEGELFNNTYLTDMKSGRMSEYMNKNVCAEELQYRNSLLPNHLRSSYVAQYGHNLAEDELKVSNQNKMNINKKDNQENGQKGETQEQCSSFACNTNRNRTIVTKKETTTNSNQQSSIAHILSTQNFNKNNKN